MFDFEKFPVYIKTLELIKESQPLLKSKSININTRSQLYRASSSILLNIAEGAGKYSKKDKKNFYIIARGSAQECVAILSLLRVEQNISIGLYKSMYQDLEEISKMLSGLINKMIASQ
jgi:four helix bundle protein